MGKLLHWFVMEQINIDMVSFPHTVLPLSYGYSLLLTFLFAFIVNLVMFQKLDKINMAESLKSIERAKQPRPVMDVTGRGFVRDAAERLDGCLLSAKVVRAGAVGRSGKIFTKVMTIFILPDLF